MFTWHTHIRNHHKNTLYFSDVDNMDDKSAVKLDGKTFLKFTNKMNKM